MIFKKYLKKSYYFFYFSLKEIILANISKNVSIFEIFYIIMIGNKNFTEAQTETDNATKVAEFEKKFQKKPYMVEHKITAKFAYYGKFLFACISILCAFYFLKSILFEAIPIEFIAVILASIFLLSIEALKMKLLPKILYAWYGYKSLKFGSILFNTILVTLSIYLSVKGIEQYSKKEMHTPPHLTNVDSLRSSYQKSIAWKEKDYTSQINTILSEKADFKEAIKYRGKIWLNKTNSDKLNAFDAQIKSLQQQRDKRLTGLAKDKREAITEAKKENKALLQEADTKTSNNTFYLVALAGLNEVLSLLCLWFVIFYQKQSIKDKNTFTTVISTASTDIDIESYISSFGPGTVQALPQNNVGFKMSGTNRNMSKNTGKTASLEQKLAGAMQDLENGIMDNRFLMQKHSLNVVQINKLKKDLGLGVNRK